MSASAREVELKLDVEPNALSRLEAHPLLAEREARSQTLPSVYFDTDDFELRDAGLSLRVRRADGTYVQTVKSGVFANPLSRGEWEAKIKGPQPDLSAAPDSPLKRVLKKSAGTLKPQFETRVCRTLRRFTNAATNIEIAIDRGEVSTGQRRAPICELELELKKGRPGELFKLARELGQNAPLLLAVLSKAERGYELVEGRSRHQFEKAVPLHIPASATAEEAFQLIARNCLRQILANRGGMLVGDAEALHQMRIGLRRLRSAISVFDDVVRDGQQQSIKQELKWITGVLGPPRDLDVLQSEVLNPISKVIPPDAGRAEAKEEFEKRRHRAHEAAAKAINSKRFADAILNVAEWVEAGPWTDSQDALISARRATSINEYASDELARRRKKIRKQGRKLSELSPRQRHKLRIRAKKLRYASEFLKDVFPGKKRIRRRKSMIGALKDLQTALGDLNDISAREHLMSKVPKEHPVSSVTNERRLSFAAGIVYGSQEAQISDLMALAKKAQASFEETKAFWN